MFLVNELNNTQQFEFPKSPICTPMTRYYPIFYIKSMSEPLSPEYVVFLYVKKLDSSATGMVLAYICSGNLLFSVLEKVMTLIGV